MKFALQLLLGLFLLNPMSVMSASETDSVHVSYYYQPIRVSAKRISWDTQKFTFEKDYLSQIAERNEIGLIRKGVSLASDLSVEGFKRGDINVVIDGERYPNACPNRMDPPTSRVNPLEMASVSQVKSSTAPQAALGGMMSFHRSTPASEWKIRGSLAGTTLSGADYDAALAVENQAQRVTARFTRGTGYENARGQDFQDLYGYKENPDYTMQEYSVHGHQADWSYGASFSRTLDIPFPYLKMDERDNKLWSGFVSYRGNKLYVNRTRHLMDNGLRAEQMMFMETDATNLTVGLIGDAYEIFYRNWDADNTLSNNMMHQENHLIPNLHWLSATVQHDIQLKSVLLAGKVGLVRASIGDEERLDLYQRLYPDAESDRWFVPFSLTTSYSRGLPANIVAGLSAEIASDPPQGENLFIALDRPMANPDWVGNPDLNAPIKTTVRTFLAQDPVRLELFGTYVWDYAEQHRQMGEQDQVYMTYTNVDGYFTGFNVSGNWRYLALNAAYTYAQNETTNQPMAEIPPFSLTARLNTPMVGSWHGFVRYTYAAEQTRVNATLNEGQTPAWNRWDLGFSYEYQALQLIAEIQNLGNEPYYQHLSYMRDPFSAGRVVHEPGRTLRLNLIWNY